tara:strand:+ start:16058 stop:16282 length:225 start_codon:yes stop_codon:yes gene_type:complete
MDVTDAMISHKKRLVEDIIKLQNTINQKNRSIKILEKELWKKCKHVWVRVNDGDDLCSKQCSRCGVYCLASLYT